MENNVYHMLPFCKKGGMRPFVQFHIKKHWNDSDELT